MSSTRNCVHKVDSLMNDSNTSVPLYGWECCCNLKRKSLSPLQVICICVYQKFYDVL